MSCSLNQAGGARATKVSEIEGTRKVLANGAVGANFLLSDGKVGFRFIEGAKAGMRAPPRAITAVQAQQAFDKYYNGAMPKFSKGVNKGADRYKSAAGFATARRNDLKWSKNVINDSRYLSRNGPRVYDFQGVDVGAGPKLVSEKQAAARAAGAARLRRLSPAARNLQQMRQLPHFQQHQQGGYWW